tara:strand:- start:22 stop:354 length:333 start_codon:yes stop_codon:yes gene_type:complete
MSKFNLKKALAGEKVITVSGSEVTNLTVMTIDGSDKLVGVYKKKIKQWNFNGSKPWNDNLHLKMAPDMGEGFLYVFANGCTTMSKEKRSRNLLNYIMCFDLSEYPIGFGL